MTTTEVPRLIDQLERAFRGEAWCGSALMETLSGVAAGQASTRPIPAAHTIWEIVLHIAGWKDTVRRRLLGEDARLPVEGDWPAPAHGGEEAWRMAVATLERRHEEMMDVVRSLEDEDLERVLITEQSRETGGGVSCYVTLHGLAQHDLYHAGQIALLRKSWR